MQDKVRVQSLSEGMVCEKRARVSDRMLIAIFSVLHMEERIVDLLIHTYL